MKWRQKLARNESDTKLARPEPVIGKYAGLAKSLVNSELKENHPRGWNGLTRERKPVL